MRIRLAILDADANFLQRISHAFTSKYPEKLEIYSFSDWDAALSGMAGARINVFLAADSFAIDISKLPRYCGFAYLVESPDIEAFRGCPAVCKYQRAESLYKAILELYADSVSDAVGLRMDSDTAVRTITFVSASGGCGSSVSAAACAKTLAAMGQRTLYLNLETFGGAESFFAGEGQSDFGDILFAIKSKKPNLSLKLESGVRQDESGVFFYASPPTALDMMAIKIEDTKKLLADIRLTGRYNAIVIDIDFSMGEYAMEIFRQSAAIVFVCDGEALGNAKFARVYRAMEIVEQQTGMALLPRICVFYNKFSNKTGKTLGDDIRSIGGAPRYEHAAAKDVVAQLAGMGVFQKLTEVL
ncbi:MAG: chromosome partitioning protein ParA [Oscillospiraceae bacterium]|nr:chromosome partitioning protein ParA [Oscillospiraceae bacterium]